MSRLSTAAGKGRGGVKVRRLDGIRAREGSKQRNASIMKERERKRGEREEEVGGMPIIPPR